MIGYAGNLGQLTCVWPVKAAIDTQKIVVAKGSVIQQGRAKGVISVQSILKTVIHKVTGVRGEGDWKFGDTRGRGAVVMNSASEVILVTEVVVHPHVQEAAVRKHGGGYRLRNNVVI